MSAREGKAPSQRQLRVAEEIRHAIAQVLERGDVHNATLARMIITVTEVRISPDLKNATAFVLPLGGGAEEIQAMLAALKDATGELRHHVAKSVRLKYTPRLSFKADPSFDEAGHINELLHSPHVAQDLKPDPKDPEEDGA